MRGERLDWRPFRLGLPAAGGQGGQRAAAGRERGALGGGRPARLAGWRRAGRDKPELELRLRGLPRRPGRPATTIEPGRPWRPRVPSGRLVFRGREAVGGRPGPEPPGGHQAAMPAGRATQPGEGAGPRLLPPRACGPSQGRPGPLGHRRCVAAPGLRTRGSHGLGAPTVPHPDWAFRRPGPDLDPGRRAEGPRAAA